MRIALTGSIATDYLMTFPGRFSEQLLDGHLAKLSLSFLVDELDIRRGGIGANIAYGLGLLGLTPALVGSVGTDFTDHDAWLRKAGVDTRDVRVSATRHTARFICTTDQEQNQIGSFYAGAMVEAREITLRPTEERLGGLDLVVVSPNDPEAMLRHTEECRSRGYPFLADPSQQLARADGEAARRLVDGARLLFTNEYEAHLLTEKTGWSDEEVLRRVGTWVTTLGERGALVCRGAERLTVPAAKPARVVDPTGAGDAFRSGYLAGLAWGLDQRGRAELGAVMATLVLETDGPQEYQVQPADLVHRLTDAYGPETGRRIESRLPGKEHA